MSFRFSLYLWSIFSFFKHWLTNFLIYEKFLIDFQVRECWLVVHLLTFKNLLRGKCIFLRTKGAKNKVFPTFEEHSLVLDKMYRQLYYNMISADIIIYKLP